MLLKTINLTILVKSPFNIDCTHKKHLLYLLHSFKNAVIFYKYLSLIEIYVCLLFSNNQTVVVVVIPYNFFPHVYC